MTRTGIPGGKEQKAMSRSVIRAPGQACDSRDPQAGFGVLGAIALLGLIFALVQGTIFYRAKASSRLMSSEKSKIQAQQVAEAGVEENIADLGSRKLRPHAGMEDFISYASRHVGTGTFTTSLTTVGVGADADTVLLTSLGRVASKTQSIQAKLRIRRYLDTLLKPIMIVDPETTITNHLETIPVATVTSVVQDPHAMPDLEETSAYAACMASGAKKCDVCHIPLGNPVNRQVINISKASIQTHFDHHGDYVTTDGTCDIYNPRNDTTFTMQNVMVPDTLITDNTVYDTVLVIDTMAKIQVLSWK